MKRHTVRITCRAIIRKDDKLFMVRQKNLNDNTENDFWCLIGGHLDPNESLHDNLIREIEEEVGVAAQIGRLLYVQQFDDPEGQYVEFFFEVTNAHDFENIDLGQTTHGQDELVEYGFINPHEVKVLPALLTQVTADLSNSESQFPIFKNYL